MLGGLLVWALHFSGVYAMASLDAQTHADDSAVWKIAVLLFSALCLAACLALAAGLRLGPGRPRPEPTVGLERQLTVLGAIGGAVAIVWQTVAALAG